VDGSGGSRLDRRTGLSSSAQLRLGQASGRWVLFAAVLGSGLGCGTRLRPGGDRRHSVQHCAACNWPRPARGFRRPPMDDQQLHPDVGFPDPSLLSRHARSLPKGGSIPPHRTAEEWNAGHALGEDLNEPRRLRPDERDPGQARPSIRSGSNGVQYLATVHRWV
jgi:hypothetical protein